MKDMYKSWIKLREDTKDEFNEKICYCGHTDRCTCGDPDFDTFIMSINRGVLDPVDPDNGWVEVKDNL